MIQRNRPALSRGFSLLEIMLVLMVTVGLSVTGTFAMSRMAEESQTAQVTADLGVFIAAFQNYRAGAPADAPAPSAEKLAGMLLFPRATVENGKLKSRVKTLAEVVDTKDGWGIVFSGFSHSACPIIISQALSSYRTNLTYIRIDERDVDFDSLDSWAQGCNQKDPPAIAFGIKTDEGSVQALAPAVQKSNGFVDPKNKRWETGKGM